MCSMMSASIFPGVSFLDFAVAGPVTPSRLIEPFMGLDLFIPKMEY